MITLAVEHGNDLLVAIGAAEAAGDPAAEKATAAACVQCYGANGQGVPPETCIGGQK